MDHLLNPIQDIYSTLKYATPRQRRSKYYKKICINLEAILSQIEYFHHASTRSSKLWTHNAITHAIYTMYAFRFDHVYAASDIDVQDDITELHRLFIQHVVPIKP